MKRTLVIALLALAAVATASFAYAAIPSTNGVISACKDVKGSLKVIDAESGQTCNGSQQLLTWNQQGPAGAPGQDGVSGYVEVEAQSASNSNRSKTAFAACPPGTVPVGGGGHLSGGGGWNVFPPYEVAVQSSFAGTYGWWVYASETVPTDDPWMIHVRAVCAHAS